MTPQLRTALVAALALATGALGGCSDTSAPAPTATTTITRSAPTQTPSSIGVGPALVDPPDSVADAIRDADDSIRGYYAASFDSGHAGGTDLDLVAPWVTGKAFENERRLAAYLQQQHYRIDGAPTAWTLSPSRSSTARTAGANGSSGIRYGAVRLVGCIESTNRPVGDGAPAWTTKARHTSIDWMVLYSPLKRQWLVTASTSPSTVLKAGSCG